MSEAAVVLVAGQRARHNNRRPRPRGTERISLLRLRNWCFTINFSGYTREQVDAAKLPPIDPKVVRYRVYSLEKCPSTGTLHFQGYVELFKATRVNGIKKIPGFERAHLEPRGGTAQEAEAYCLPVGLDGTPKPSHIAGPFKEGKLSVESQGERTDLRGVCAQVKPGVSIKELADIDRSVFVRHSDGLRRLQAALIPDRQENPDVYVFWGQAGAGKSRTATAAAVAAGKSIYRKFNTKWWDGYCGQSCVIWDEFDPLQTPIDELKLILDRYSVEREVKNGHVSLCFDTIYLTCNTNPREWYANGDASVYEPLERRFKEVREFVFAPGCTYNKPVYSQCVCDSAGVLTPCNK